MFLGFFSCYGHGIENGVSERQHNLENMNSHFYEEASQRARDLVLLCLMYPTTHLDLGSTKVTFCLFLLHQCFQYLVLICRPKWQVLPV